MYLMKKWNVQKRTIKLSQQPPPPPHPREGLGAAVAMHLGEKQKCLENER